MVRELPKVSLGSFDGSSLGINLSDIIEPSQSYLLNSSSAHNFFGSAESISLCVELLAEFGDKAVHSGYDP